MNVHTLLEKFVFKTLAFLAAVLGMENIPLAQGTDVCTPGFSADETGSNRFLLLLFLALVILTLWFALRRSVRRLVELDYQLVAARQQIALLERDLAEAEGRQVTVEGSAICSDAQLQRPLSDAWRAPKANAGIRPCPSSLC